MEEGPHGIVDRICLWTRISTLILDSTVRCLHKSLTRFYCGLQLIGEKLRHRELKKVPKDTQW